MNLPRIVHPVRSTSHQLRHKLFQFLGPNVVHLHKFSYKSSNYFLVKGGKRRTGRLRSHWKGGVDGFLPLRIIYESATPRRHEPHGITSSSTRRRTKFGIEPELRQVWLKWFKFFKEIPSFAYQQCFSEISIHSVWLNVIRREAVRWGCSSQVSNGRRSFA